MQSGIVQWCFYIACIGAGLVATARPANAQTTGSPSFNCALARSEVEHLICAVPSLQAKDNALARQYAAALARNPDQVAVIKQDQIAWWRRRNACAGPAAEMADCVGRLYDARMEDLSISTAPPVEATAEPPKRATQADINAALQAMESVKAALKDPEKVKLIECMGVQVYENPQPRGHPPSAAECDRLTAGMPK
jgi:uncharacterized protein